MNPKARFLLDALGKKQQPIMCEIGCIRVDHEDETDGWSTVYLGREADKRKGYLFSCDTSVDACQVASKVVARLDIQRVKVANKGGSEFLDTWAHGKIDLLYLDGGDNPYFTLRQAKAAMPHLCLDAVVVIDDVQPIGQHYFGKGEFAIPYLVQEGWNCLIVPTVKRENGRWAMAKLWR